MLHRFWLGAYFFLAVVHGSDNHLYTKIHNPVEVSAGQQILATLGYHPSLFKRPPNLFFDSSANHPDLALPFCKPQAETHQGHPTKQMLQGLWLAS